MNKAHGRAVERLPAEWAARVAVGQDPVDALKAEHVRALEHRGGIVNIKTDGAMVLRNALLCQLLSSSKWTKWRWAVPTW